MNCNSIQYGTEGGLSYGVIYNFFKTDAKNILSQENNILCVVRKFDIIDDSQFIATLSKTCSKNISRFYNQVHVSNKYEIIELTTITKIKICVLVPYKDNFIITPLVSSYESD